MSPEAAERAITPNTRAILPTHLYGMACDLDPILALAKRYNLKVVEDCAHALGAQYKGRMVGTDGDASFFSFQAFKPLNTFGGGLTWVRDAGVAKRVSEFAAAGAVDQAVAFHFLVLERRRDIDAVLRGVVRQIYLQQRGERRHQIRMRDRLVARRVLRPLAGPANNERHPMAAFPQVALIHEKVNSLRLFCAVF